MLLNKDGPNFLLLPILIFFFGACYILTPLFHLNISPNEYAPGFLPLRIVNADLKFIVVAVCMSVISCCLMVSLHLKGECLKYPKVFLCFLILFLVGVLISTITCHNFMRAWVSSLQWHIIPLFFALFIGQISWNRKHIICIIGLLLAGGVISCLITLDQHYRWTDWSHRIVRNGYAGIIFNHNFAAEYHAPLIPLAVGLFFYLRSRIGRLLCALVILGIFLPALSLSMARGAWVGHIGGCLGIVILLIAFLRFTRVQPKIDSSVKKKSVWLSFVGLGLALPFFLYTSDYWKKDGAGWDRFTNSSVKELNPHDLNDSTGIATSKPTQTMLFETREAKELKSILTSGSERRFVLWEDALRECFTTDFLFGKGTDHYELFYHESAKLSDKNWGNVLVRFVHNDFIQTFYENGVIGLIGWLGIWGYVTWTGLSACIFFYRIGDDAELGLRMGLVACILCFLIEAFFEFPTRSPCAMLVGWSALGILLGLNLQNRSTEERNLSFDLKKRPIVNLAIGVIGVVLPVYTGFLSKDLFWANVYHFQGRAAGDALKPQLSLHFHQESIGHAPWQHLSRKAEGYLLITREKRYLDAMKSIEKTLQVHPGCLQAHQNRIALLINEFKNPQAAKIAFMDMKKAAPYHRFTRKEEKKLIKLFEKSPAASELK